MAKQRSKKKKLLEGHKRVGKRFIPPMKQVPLMKSTSYVNDMLPELVWAGLLNEKFGYIEAARMLEKIFLILDGIEGVNQHGNFALVSTFSLLSQDKKNIVKLKFAEAELLDLIRNCLAPLILLYDHFPLSFLGPPATVFSNDELVSSIKNCVGKIIDKYDTPGIVLHGVMLLSRLVTKKISFPSDMELPDFNSVINSPNSEEAKRAAGFMRANALGEFGMLNINFSWAEYFWNRGAELSPCEFRDREQAK